MHRLEFKEVIKYTGINNPLSTITNKCGLTEEVHYWNNNAIWFDSKGCAIINGRIPLEVANIIYQKYSNDSYGIRINGISNNVIPIDYAVDEIYEMEIQEYKEQNLSASEYLEKCKNARKNLEKRENNKYLKNYHIYTKEGFLIFLVEMKDYFLRANNMPETEVEKYDELMSKICFEMLEKINPTISAYEWMQNDRKHKDKYNFSIERDKNTKSGQMLRSALLDFDKAVNPFLNDDVQFDDINNWLKKVNIDADLYSFQAGKYRTGCCYLEISIPEFGSTIYYRTPDGFLFKLVYKLENNKRLIVSHSFTTYGNCELNKGEIIAINYFDDNTKNKTSIIFNITSEQIFQINEENSMNSAKFDSIYNELLKAIKYASNITIQNMIKKECVKQLG